MKGNQNSVWALLLSSHIPTQLNRVSSIIFFLYRFFIKGIETIDYYCGFNSKTKTNFLLFVELLVNSQHLQPPISPFHLQVAGYQK